MKQLSLIFYTGLLLLCTAASVCGVRCGGSTLEFPFCGSRTPPCPGPQSSPGLCAVSLLPCDHTDTVVPFAPRTYGVKTVQGFSAIITKGDSLPRSQTRRYTTRYDNQTEALVQIYEKTYPYEYGSRRVRDYQVSSMHNTKKIRDFEIKHIPKNRAGREFITVTFDVNDRGTLYATAVVDSTGEREALSIMSSALNTVVPDHCESEDKTVRPLTAGVLGRWFWEVNTDITTLNQSLARFEAHPAPAELALQLNNFVEHSMPLVRYTDAASGWVDYAARNADFHQLVDTIVRRIRSSVIQTDLPYGLQQVHFKAFFEVNIPALIRHLNSRARGTTPGIPQLHQGDWTVVGAPGGAHTGGTVCCSGSGPDDEFSFRPVHFRSRYVKARHSSKQRGFTGPIYVETMDPHYLISVGGYSGGYTELQGIARSLNFFAGVNGRIYESQTWGQTQFDSDRMGLVDLLRGLTKAQQRRGGFSEEPGLNQIVQVLVELQQGYDLSFDTVVQKLKEEFGL